MSRVNKISKRSAKRVTKVSREEGKDEVIPTQTSTTYFSAEFAPGRHLVYSQFNGKDLIQFREYAVMGERKYPTKKGVCLTPGRLRALMEIFDDIDEQLKQQKSDASYKVQSSSYKSHLGAGIYVTVDTKFSGVDLRRYWVPEGQLSIVPTKNGLYLPSSQWSSLKEKLGELLIARPELSIAEQCYHDNQMGMMDCRECLPFGWIIMDLNK